MVAGSPAAGRGSRKTAGIPRLLTPLSLAAPPRDQAAQPTLGDGERGVHLFHGNSRMRMLRKSIGDPSDSRHKKPVRGSMPLPPDTSSPFTHRRISPLIARK